MFMRKTLKDNIATLSLFAYFHRRLWLTDGYASLNTALVKAQ